MARESEFNHARLESIQDEAGGIKGLPLERGDVELADGYVISLRKTQIFRKNGRVAHRLGETSKAPARQMEGHRTWDGYGEKR